jgi:DNA replication and repair protein RecF
VSRVRVRHLSLTDFRNYRQAELELAAGVSTFLGANGQGKTNLLEALGYLASGASHRVATDAPLVRTGAERAVLRVAVVRGDRELLVEVEINPGRANRARLGRAAVPRPSEVVGVLRTVLFAPEDLALVKGDPEGRRRFLDELLTVRSPRFSAVRADYDRVLRQRNSLLRTAAAARRGGARGELATLDVWDQHLATAGAELLAGRLDLVQALRPHLLAAHEAVAAQPVEVVLRYRSNLSEPAAEVPVPGFDQRIAAELLEGTGRDELAAALLGRLAALRGQELDRGVTLAGPHRDDLLIELAGLPAKGYASHGESWSLALALRLASYELMRADGGEPVLLLDDVFAELDTSRRRRLAELVAGAEQVLVTAAVDDDVPAVLAGTRFRVSDAVVRGG